MLRVLMCWLVTVALVGARVRAQLPDEVQFFQGTLAEAAARARADGRLLIVFMQGDDRRGEDAFDKVLSHTLMNRSLRQWIEWHGVLARVQYREDPDTYSRIEARTGNPGRNVGGQFDMRRDPYFLVFRDDQMEHVVPWPYLLPMPGSDFGEGGAQDSRDPLRLRYHWVRGLQGLTPPPEPLSDEGYVKPLELLSQLDLCLERLHATEPVWAAHHDRLNPPPPAPDRVYVSEESDADGSRWPLLGETPSVWESLTLARQHVVDGDQHLATGIYTWLWEHGAESCAWLQPLRRTLIAEEMRRLGDRRAGSRARFERVRGIAGERYAWSDFIERWDWVILSEITGDSLEMLVELDYSMNDADEGSLASTTEQSGLRLLAQRSPWSDPWSVKADDVKRLDAIRALEGQKPAARATAEEWGELVALRRAVLLSEACRIHAAFLRSGRDAEAMRIATDLIKGDPDGTCRLALAAMAWGAGVSDGRHAAWVKEAVALGADDVGLRAAMLQGGPDDSAAAQQPRRGGE